MIGHASTQPPPPGELGERALNGGVDPRAVAIAPLLTSAIREIAKASRGLERRDHEGRWLALRIVERAAWVEGEHDRWLAVLGCVLDAGLVLRKGTAALVDRVVEELGEVEFDRDGRKQGDHGHDAMVRRAGGGVECRTT